MTEPVFLYRTHAQTMLDLLQSAPVAAANLNAIVTQLDAGLRNLTDPVRLLLDSNEAGALERALQQVLPPEQQTGAPWATMLARLASIRGAVPERRWRA